MFALDKKIEIPTNIDIRQSIGYSGEFELTNEHLSMGDIIVGKYDEVSTPCIEDVLVHYLTSINEKGESTACSYCGNGDDEIVLLSIKIGINRIYALLRYWSGCLTYDKTELSSTLLYSDSIQDLYDTADQQYKKILLDNQNAVLYQGIVEELSEHLLPSISSSIIMPYLCHGVIDETS